MGLALFAVSRLACSSSSLFVLASNSPRRSFCRQLAGFRFASRRLHADAVASGYPFQLVTRTDAVLISDLLRHSELELAGNLGHNPYFIKDWILTAGDTSIGLRSASIFLDGGKEGD
jgi:hypothetical protein